MGMDFGDGPDFDAIKAEREAAKNKGNEKKEKEPTYTIVGNVTFNKLPYLLLVGEDKKWYKAEYLGKKQISPSRNTPKFNKWNTDNITPVTEDEFYSYFARK